MCKVAPTTLYPTGYVRDHIGVYEGSSEESATGFAGKQGSSKNCAHSEMGEGQALALSLSAHEKECHPYPSKLEC